MRWGLVGPVGSWIFLRGFVRRRLGTLLDPLTDDCQFCGIRWCPLPFGWHSETGIPVEDLKQETLRGLSGYQAGTAFTPTLDGCCRIKS